MRRLSLKRISWAVVALFVLVSVVICILVYQRDNATIQKLNGELEGLSLQVTQNQQEASDLQNQMDSLGTLAQLEAAARQQDFIKQDELLFEVVNDDLLENYTQEEWAILMEERKLGMF